MDAPSFESNPFGSLAIWREKVIADVGDATDPDSRLTMLLEQGKDVEEAVQGCLRDSLVELSECEAWGLLQPSFANIQRQHLYSSAAQELLRNKQHCVELAREHNLMDDYAREVKKRINHTIADYERLGDLRFGLSCWKANLRRDTSLASDSLEVARIIEESYLDALRLIRRCASNSQRFWAAQAASNSPTTQARRAVQTAAVEIAQKMILEEAQRRPGVEMSVPALFARVSDPEAVSIEGEEGSASPRPSKPPVFKSPASQYHAASIPESVASMSDLA